MILRNWAGVILGLAISFGGYARYLAYWNDPSQAGIIILLGLTIAFCFFNNDRIRKERIKREKDKEEFEEMASYVNSTVAKKIEELEPIFEAYEKYEERKRKRAEEREKRHEDMRVATHMIPKQK